MMTMRRKNRPAQQRRSRTPMLRGVLAASLSVLAAPAVAEDGDDDDDESAELSISIGAGVLANPKFNGADSLELVPVPLIDIEWRNRLFINTKDGIGVWLVKRSNDPEYALGVSIGYDFDAREFGKNPRYVGLEETKGTVEAKLLGEFELGFIDIELEAAKAISKSGHDGFKVTAGAALGLPLGEDGYIGAGPFVRWADAKHNRSFYGITPLEATRSGRPAYRPGSGFERAGVELEAEIPLGAGFLLLGFAEYGRLLGDAAKSPIVENKNQFEALLGLSFRF